jgi:hypothetical protein
MAKFYKNGIEWGGPNEDWYYFYWWNWLSKGHRYVGYVQDWYDNPFSHIGFWFFNWSWFMPWTRHHGDKSFLYYSEYPVDKKSS